MLSIKKEIARILQRQLQDMSVEEIENSIEIPTDSSMGDYAFPCFRLAKALRKPPHVIAGELASSIGDNELFARTEAVKAYVNMFIDGQWLARITLEDVCGAGDDFDVDLAARALADELGELLLAMGHRMGRREPAREAVGLGAGGAGREGGQGCCRQAFQGSGHFGSPCCRYAG